MSKLEPDDKYAPIAAKLANVIAQKVRGQGVWAKIWTSAVFNTQSGLVFCRQGDLAVAWIECFTRPLGKEVASVWVTRGQLVAEMLIATVVPSNFCLLGKINSKI